MKKITLVVIAFALSICFSSQVFADIQFYIDVHKIKEKQASDKKISKEVNKSKMLVEIGDTCFSYVQDDIKHVYDFANKRILTIKLTNKTFEDDSLFSIIGFRTYEFQNRLMLGGAFAAAKIEDNLMLPVLSEHLFSLQQKDKKSELSQTSLNNSVSFSAAGKELLSYTKQGEQVSAANKKMFIKFFRYVFGGYPQILEQLSSDNIIPESININRYDIFKESDDLKISQIRTIPPKILSLTGYNPTTFADGSDPLPKFLNDIKYSKTINMQNHLDLLLSRANEYYRNGNYIDTMLAYLEYNLASGLPFPQIFQEQSLTLKKDENVNKLLTALSSKRKEDAENNLIALQQLEGVAKHQGHVIKIFEANLQIRLGKTQEAKILFIEALKASPYITGVYKDLGDLYYSQYNTVMAWRCWDIARKLAPTHKMLMPINEFESKLMKNYPEYF
ncbi:MAG: hypothetical protein ABSD50_10570 [Smithella sp.]